MLGLAASKPRHTPEFAAKQTLQTGEIYILGKPQAKGLNLLKAIL